MSKILQLAFIDIRSFQDLLTRYGLKITGLTIALFTTPLIARSGSIVCETTQVIYNSKPALQTVCKDLVSGDTWLDSAINSKSLSYDQSLESISKAASIFGYIYQEDQLGVDYFYPGFTDQRIPKEGAKLELIYNQMLENQFVRDPIRTMPEETPFNQF